MVASYETCIRKQVQDSRSLDGVGHLFLLVPVQAVVVPVLNGRSCSHEFDEEGSVSPMDIKMVYGSDCSHSNEASSYRIRNLSVAFRIFEIARRDAFLLREVILGLLIAIFNWFIDVVAL